MNLCNDDEEREEYERRVSCKRGKLEMENREEREGTNPSWHSLFSSSCFLIMLTMISSGTSPPCRDEQEVTKGRERGEEGEEVNEPDP